LKRATLVAALSLGLLWPSASQAAVTEGGVEVGFAQRWLYRVPIELGTLTGAIAVRTPGLSFSFPVGLEWGRTLEGLSVFQGHLGFLLEGVVGRLRLGLGTGVGGLTISRVTSSGSFDAGFFDVVGRVSVDLVPFGEPRRIDGEGPIDGETPTSSSAFFVATEFRANTAQVFGPSLSLGVRY